MPNDVWFLPLGPEPVLIYAPFHGISTLVNRAMAEVVCACLRDGSEPVPEDAPWIESLRGAGKRPEMRKGLPDPLFLGLVPTRGCMMRCAYCDFVTAREHPQMSFAQIRSAVDGYARVMREAGRSDWNIHFFGGEPFAAFKEVVFAVNYARSSAEKAGASVHFEVTTNGFYSETKARWIAEYIDTVVLSLDGFPEVQNRHRPGPGGQESFDTVCRSADIFSRGSCEFIIRSCVSAENAENLGQWASFLAKRFQPEAVCLEPMIESDLARQHGLTPPDADVFVRNWADAFRVLEAEKIRLVCSSADLTSLNPSLCPMGRDALIVTPEGEIGSCWQLSENQPSENHFHGTDGRNSPTTGNCQPATDNRESATAFHFGSLGTDGMEIDEGSLNGQRQLVESNREGCRGCFCYAHCAGGCVLNRERSGNFCRITKALTLWQLLRQLGYEAWADQLIADRSFLDRLENITDYRSLLPGFDTVAIDSSLPPSDTRSPVGSFPLTDRGSLSDAKSGWIRDGNRILIADTVGNFVKVIEGQDALRFQLEHSGLTAADAENVWAALTEERN